MTANINIRLPLSNRIYLNKLDHQISTSHPIAPLSYQLNLFKKKTYKLEHRKQEVVENYKPSKYMQPSQTQLNLNLKFAQSNDSISEKDEDSLNGYDRTKRKGSQHVYKHAFFNGKSNVIYEMRQKKSQKTFCSVKVQPEKRMKTSMDSEIQEKFKTQMEEIKKLKKTIQQLKLKQEKLISEVKKEEVKTKISKIQENSFHQRLNRQIDMIERLTTIAFKKI